MYFLYVFKIYEQSLSHLLERGEESTQKVRKKDTATGREIKHFLNSSCSVQVV